MSANNDNRFPAEAIARLVREAHLVPRAEAEHHPIERSREERDLVGRRVREATHGT